MWHDSDGSSDQTQLTPWPYEVVDAEEEADAAAEEARKEAKREARRMRAKVSEAQRRNDEAVAA
eukprot:1821915-Heterocapsa_arctica.AAC.1